MDVFLIYVEYNLEYWNKAYILMIGEKSYSKREKRIMTLHKKW